MVDLRGTGEGEFSVGRMAGCRCPFTVSTLTVLALEIRKCKLMDDTVFYRTQTSPQNPQQPGAATTSPRHATKHVPRVSSYPLAPIAPGIVEPVSCSPRNQLERRMLHIHLQTDRQTNR